MKQPDTISPMKHVLTVFGVVHPQGGGWYLDAPFTTTAEDGSKIQIVLNDSAYLMRIESEGPDNIDASMGDGSLGTWLNEVIYGHQPLLRGLLDSLGLHLGANLEPEMTGGTLDGVVTIGNLMKLRIRNAGWRTPRRWRFVLSHLVDSRLESIRSVGAGRRAPRVAVR
jgi:hypothetical protein